ncbi:sulfotransferase [Streptomyces sp. TRM 70361]|uniref:sulfotransferase n=1 Tax=Streptomyces sp. TRM 70361 TaxID=3116553 RepID=UPI002E7C563B|nr:sulfotransferase [Streptomyces sp. TRM 70361]MEE1942693.1 sulfotransferase [Streptomyces sp. TRM 70361]
MTFVVGTGRSGSTALSRVLNRHPDVLSLNELLASIGLGGMPEGELTGEEFWRLLADPNPTFDRMIRSGAAIPEFLYPRSPGRFSAEAGGIPALCLMVLPHLTDDPDGLLDELALHVPAWPRRPAEDQYRALFGLLADRFGRRAVVERSGFSVRWVPRLRTGFPEAGLVHLYRGGPDCALSMSRHTGFRLITLLGEIYAALGLEFGAELTEEHARSLPPDLGGLLADPFDARLVFDRAIPVSVFGALWSRLVTECLAELEKVPETSRMALSYENLLDAPEKELSRLAAFAGVAPGPEWLAAGRALLDPGRRGAALRLPPGELNALREACEPGERALAEAYGRGHQR